MQIARDSDFIKGLYSIQGEGSMLAAEAVGTKHGMSVLDCCAAPGGRRPILPSGWRARAAYMRGICMLTGWS